MARYYLSLLDTVNFASSEPVSLRNERILRATSSIMLDLLVGYDVPVLSQTQAFDGAMLLGIVGRGGADAEALVKLIQQSRLQMRVHGDLVTQRSSLAETFSLKNAFMSALSGSLKFSAWPELDDPEVRAHMLAHLEGRSSQAPTGELGERLDALLRMDMAFRESDASERATDGGDSIADRVDDHLQHLDSAGAYLRELKREVAAWLHRLDPSDQGHYDLSRRSGWYLLLDDFQRESGRAPGHGGIKSLRRVVDVGYNLRVATSLGALSLGEHEERLDLAGVLRRNDLTTDFQHQTAVFLEDDPARIGLTWASAEARLSERGVDTDTPAARERRMRELIADKCAVEHDHGKLAAVVRFGRSAMTDAAASIAAGSIGGVVGGVPGALAGAAIGVVVSNAGEKIEIEKQVARWNIARLVRVSKPAAEVRVPISKDKRRT